MKAPDDNDIVREIGHGAFDPRDGVIPIRVRGHRDTAQPAPANTPYAETGATREHLTELGNARRLVAQHGRDLRYCHPWQKWLVWDGRRWKPDDTAEVVRRAKATVADLYHEAASAATEEERKESAGFAMKSEKAAAIAAMLKLAESEAGIPVLPPALDADPSLLTVENGTLDLKTGELRPHRREDFITRLAPAAFVEGATCPTWHAFLLRIFDGCQRVIDYVQRFLGYCLTGDVSEHCMLVAYGTGRNGKSTLFETASAVLGNYAGTVPSDLLLVKRGDPHPTERARLFGLRLAVCSETASGRKLDEAALKKITGGDKIDARRMREDFWDFMPTHKLVLYTNHRPSVRTTDEGTWSKLLLLPFTTTIPKAERNRKLKDKLLAERSGILAWMAKGAVDWYREGLGECPEVLAATQAYREEQDRIAGFLTERCELRQGVETSFKQLYGAYQSWCETLAEEPVPGRTFGERLTERGIEGRHRNRGNVRIGIVLRDGEG